MTLTEWDSFIISDGPTCNRYEREKKNRRHFLEFYSTLIIAGSRSKKAEPQYGESLLAFPEFSRKWISLSSHKEADPVGSDNMVMDRPCHAENGE